MAKRENGYGSIVRRQYKSGVRYVAFAPARYETGAGGKMRCVRESLGSFRKKSEAVDALEEYRKHPTSKYNITLRELHQNWERNAYDGLSDQTIANWQTAWKLVERCPDPELPDMLVRNILTDDMRSLIKYYSAPFEQDGKQRKAMSFSSLSKLKSLLTQLFDYALENRIVDQNYASLVKLPKNTSKKKRAFTDLEFAKLQQAVKDGVEGADAILVLCYTGFRISELCALTAFSYNKSAQTLTGGMKTEAGTDRVVPIHKNIQPIIARWAARRCGTLLADAEGNPYDYNHFRRMVWKKVASSIGLPDDLTIHCCRHTCATRLSAAGVKPEDIVRILGHEDYNLTVKTYINQDISTLTASMAMVE